MRQIKFRAKTVTEGEWIFSMTISKGTIKRKKDCLFMEISEGNWKQIIPETLCQYTGRKDFTHQEIYDGDIIGRPDGKDAIVQWSDTESAFEIIYKKDSGCPWSNLLTNYLEDCADEEQEFMIKGNKYDNPELINQFNIPEVLVKEAQAIIKKEEELIRPFSNGTEFMVWQDHNCCQCNLYENESTEESEAGCKLAFNLDLSCIDGKLPINIAKEIGLNGNRLNPECNKIQKEE